MKRTKKPALSPAQKALLLNIYQSSMGAAKISVNRDFAQQEIRGKMSYEGGPYYPIFWVTSSTIIKALVEAFGFLEIDPLCGLRHRLTHEGGAAARLFLGLGRKMKRAA
jgi:hypothetical protein